MYVNDLESIISVIDISLSSSRKRHIVGGMLLSVSLLFGGLAITVMTLAPHERESRMRRE